MAECWPSSFLLLFLWTVHAGKSRSMKMQKEPPTIICSLSTFNWSINMAMGKYVSAGGKQDTLSREH